MSRTARSLAGFGAGAVLTAAALLGLTSSRLPSGWAEEPLDLRGYCRSTTGTHASAYQPRDTSAWRCGVWRNGVWGLEAVDLDAACAWQRGDGAALKEVEEARPSGHEAESEVLCTL